MGEFPAMATQTEFDPTDLEGREARDEERRQRAISVALQKREDLIWLLSGRRGRRRVRRQLREAGFDISRDEVSTVFDPHHGRMCFHEGLRTLGLQLIWPIMRLVASGELPFDSFRDLMTEIDE